MLGISTANPRLFRLSEDLTSNEFYLYYVT